MYGRLAHRRARGRRAGLAALTRVLEADKKDGAFLAEVADRAEAAATWICAEGASRLIVANNAAGAMSLPEAFLRQARISHRRGENEKAILVRRRAAQEAPAGGDLQREARQLIEVIEAAPAGARR